MNFDAALAKVGTRHWSEIKRSWQNHMSNVGTGSLAPDPGVERLTTLQSAELSDGTVHTDVEGLRANALAEAVFLYHKAAHAQLAVARLSMAGMTSWGMFNAYHAAYLNAKAVMSLLGVVFTKVRGGDSIIDVFPMPERRRNNRTWSMRDDYETFFFARVAVDQRCVWRALVRCCEMTLGGWEGTDLRGRIRSLTANSVPPPRNKFLYNASFWPALDDLAEDVFDHPWEDLVGGDMDPDGVCFLLNLSMGLHDLSRELFQDFAKESNLFEKAISSPRWPGPEAASWGAAITYANRSLVETN